MYDDKKSWPFLNATYPEYHLVKICELERLLQEGRSYNFTEYYRESANLYKGLSK